MRSVAPWRDTIFSQVLPNQLDNFHYSETYAVIFQDESVDIDMEPSYSCDAELDDDTIGRALSSLFIQEREEPVNLRLAYHFHEKKFVANSVFHPYGETRTRTKFRFLTQTEIKSRPGKWSNQDSHWKTRSKFSLKSEPASWSTNFKPILIEETSRNLLELVVPNQGRFIILLQVMNNSDEIN